MEKFPRYLTYDDVLLLPRYDEVTRSEVSLATNLTKRLTLSIPLLSAPMDTVTEAKLALALASEGGLGVIHKNMSASQQAALVAAVKRQKKLAAAAISYGEGALERALALRQAGADALVIDTAHGHSKGVIAMTRLLKHDGRFRSVEIVAGNVGTAEGVRALIKAGADAVKVGIGPGSICTTRIVAGIGVPQLSAVLEAVKAAKGSGVPIIADGGISHSGDIVKALAAGAAAVMVGRLLAGTKESPGKLVTVGGKKYKTYRGMGSFEAMQQGSKDRYGQAHSKRGELIPEGVSARVPYTGTLHDVVTQLMGGLTSGMVYMGARNLKELKAKAKFIRITQASLMESHPHHLSAIDEAPNYKAGK